MKHVFVGLIACLLSFSSLASSITTTKITRVLVGPGYGNNVILTINPLPDDLPDCQTNKGYNYVFDGTTEVGKMTLSSVLIAYSSRADVWLAGNGSCSLYSGIESLKHIVIK